MHSSTWPQSLWIVRHGESSGNVARDLAEAEERDSIDIAERDVDVPLSDLGRSQSEALGRWIAGRPEDEQPTVVWTSPYVRARQTADLAMHAAGLEVPVVSDERLREREFGVLDRLTRRGITAHFPDEAERRARLGKFYHRPPGGESWSDVLLRVRTALDDVRREAADERVLLVAHQVVVLLVRYVLERMDEQQILAVDADGDVANCSVTSYRYGGGPLLSLEHYNATTHLEQQDEPVTAESDVPGAPR